MNIAKGRSAASVPAQGEKAFALTSKIYIKYILITKADYYKDHSYQFDVNWYSWIRYKWHDDICHHNLLFEKIFREILTTRFLSEAVNQDFQIIYTFIKYRVNYSLVFIVYIYIKKKWCLLFVFFNHFTLVDGDYNFFGWIMSLFSIFLKIENNEKD